MGGSAPKVKATPPTVSQAEIQQQAADARKRAIMAKGRKSTNLVNGDTGNNYSYRLGGVGA